MTAPLPSQTVDGVASAPVAMSDDAIYELIGCVNDMRRWPYGSVARMAGEQLADLIAQHAEFVVEALRVKLSQQGSSGEPQADGAR